MVNKFLSILVTITMTLGLSSGFAYADSTDVFVEEPQPIEQVEITDDEPMLEEILVEDVIEPAESVEPVVLETPVEEVEETVIEEPVATSLQDEYPIATLGAMQGLTPMSGHVYLDAYISKGGTPAPAGTFTYEFAYDAALSNNTAADPTGGQTFTVTNGDNGTIEIPLLNYQWEADTGMYVYKITQLPNEKYEPLVTNQTGYDYYPAVQYIYVETDWMHNANGKWFQSVQKENSPYKSEGLDFVNVPLPEPEVTTAPIYIKKIVEYGSLVPNENIEFSFHLSCGDVEEDFTLKANEVKSFVVPMNTPYTITENNIPAGFTAVGWDWSEHFEAGVIGHEFVTGATLTCDEGITYEGAHIDTITNRYMDVLPQFPVVDVDPVLVIGKKVIVPSGWQAVYDKQEVNTEFTFEVTINDVTTTYKLKANETKVINLKQGDTYSVKEILSLDGKYTLKGTTVSTELTEGTLEDGVNGTNGVVETASVEVEITNNWIPSILPGPIPELGVTPEEPDTPEGEDPTVPEETEDPQEKDEPITEPTEDPTDEVTPVEDTKTPPSDTEEITSTDNEEGTIVVVEGLAATGDNLTALELCFVLMLISSGGLLYWARKRNEIRGN